MKKTFFALVLSLISFTSAFAQFLETNPTLKKISQMEAPKPPMNGRVSLGVNGGFAVVEESAGIALGAFVEFMSKDFSFVPQANYWRVGKASNFELAGLGRLYLAPGKLNPYFDGGLGINFYTTDEVGKKDFTKLGIIFGGGIELSNTGASFTILFDGKYKLIVNDGGNISGVVLTAGLRFGVQ